MNIISVNYESIFQLRTAINFTHIMENTIPKVSKVKTHTQLDKNTYRAAVRFLCVGEQ